MDRAVKRPLMRAQTLLSSDESQIQHKIPVQGGILTLNCNPGHVVQYVYLGKILPGRQPRVSFQSSKLLHSCKFDFPFQTSFKFSTKTLSNTTAKGLIQSATSQLSSRRDFTCRSGSSLFAFKRGNPEIGNAPGNTQPGWQAARGHHELMGTRAMALAYPGEPTQNFCGSS